MSKAGLGVRAGPRAGAGAGAGVGPGPAVRAAPRGGAGVDTVGGPGSRQWSESSSEESSSCESAPREGYSSSTGSLSPWSSDAACTPPASAGPCSACRALNARCTHWGPHGHPPGVPQDGGKGTGTGTGAGTGTGTGTGTVRGPVAMCSAQRAQSLKAIRAPERALSATEELQRILDEFDADTDSESGSGSLGGSNQWGIGGQENGQPGMGIAVAPRIRLARGKSCNMAVALRSQPSMDGKSRRVQFEEGVVLHRGSFRSDKSTIYSGTSIFAHTIDAERARPSCCVKAEGRVLSYLLENQGPSAFSKSDTLEANRGMAPLNVLWPTIILRTQR